MSRIIAPIAAIAAAVLVGGSWPATRDVNPDQFAQCRASAGAGGTVIGGTFELVNAKAEPVTDKDVIIDPQMKAFG